MSGNQLTVLNNELEKVETKASILNKVLSELHASSLITIHLEIEDIVTFSLDEFETTVGDVDTLIGDVTVTIPRIYYTERNTANRQAIFVTDAAILYYYLNEECFTSGWTHLYRVRFNKGIKTNDFTFLRAHTEIYFIDISEFPDPEKVVYDWIDRYTVKDNLPELIPYCKRGKWGFCNRNKQLVIDCIYDSIDFFENGISEVSLKNVEQIIDSKGRLLLSSENISTDLYNHCLYSKTQDGTYKRYIVFYDGDCVFIDDTFSEGLCFLSNDLIGVQVKGKWGLINQYKKTVLNFVLDNIEFDEEREEVVALYNSKWYQVSSDGKLLSETVFLEKVVQRVSHQSDRTTEVKVERPGKEWRHLEPKFNRGEFSACDLSTNSLWYHQGDPGYVDTNGNQYWEN